MAPPNIQSQTDSLGVPGNPEAHFDSPMEVVWEPHLNHDQRISTLELWLARERTLFRTDRDTDRVARMRQIESALRALQATRRSEGFR